MSAQNTFSGTRKLSADEQIDTHRLQEWLRTHVCESNSPILLERFNGGQSNPTYRFCVGEETFVLRRKPSGKLLPSAHAIDREFRVLQALERSDVPVAKPYAYCDDLEIVGAEFYVMGYVEGRIYWDPTLAALSAQERSAHYDELNRVIAAMHRLDPAERGLSDFGKPGKFIERQVSRWTKQYIAAQTEVIPEVERLIEWLPAHLPPDNDPRLVHGDFRLDNVIFHPKEPRILAVLDWELATLGDPLADFAYHCMRWRMQSPNGLAGVCLQDLGIPTEEAYTKRYFDSVGLGSIDPQLWNYYLVFNMFRLIGILQGVKRRALQGNAASPRALEMAARIVPLAEQAWSTARATYRG